MLGDGKMNGGREINNNYAEYCHLQHKIMLFEGMNFQSSGNSCSSSYNTPGFCYPDVVVGSSSSSVPPFDHHTQKTSFVDQFYLGSNHSGGPGPASSGVIFDEIGLARDFQKMDIGNGNSDAVAQFHRDSGMFRVSDCSSNVGQNFGVLEGLYTNGLSGNGGFQNPVYRDEKGLGKRGGDLGGSFGSNSGYAVHGYQNCLIDYTLKGMGPQGDEYSENGGVSSLRENKYCGFISLHDRDDFRGKVSMPRGGGYDSNGVVIGRGDVGYGGEVPLQVEPGYGPRVVGDDLQQCMMMDGFKEMLNSWTNSQKLGMYKPAMSEALLEQYGRQYLGNVGGLSSLDASLLMNLKQGLSRESVLLRERMRAVEKREDLSPVALMRRGRNHESYGASERALVFRDKGLDGAIGKSNQFGGRKKNLLRGNTLHNIGERNFELNVPLLPEGICDGSGLRDPLILQTLYNSLVEVRGNIYLLAKDQHGCRFLQKKFEEGSFEDVQLIFNEIIDHIVELMINPFGNYLIQKLLEVCNEEQRMRIVLVVTKDPGELVKISLNTHGTRVVQKLIESLKTRKQISLVVRALEPGFLELIKDLNGNHVVQRCLQCLSSDDVKFIVDAAAKFCVEIGTHRHGCCVLQRCIDHTTGENRRKLLEQICRHGLILAEDPFGNYVVQYIIELEIPHTTAQLISQFEGNFVQLSTQKFSSHVVEKCLKLYEDCQARIVYELISVPQFEQLVQDPFANYVLQSALQVTKGAIYESLVTAVRPHSMLRTNPHSKKIFSRGLLNK